MNNNAIEIKGLVKEYKDFKLGPLDLILESGTIMGLVGENGAGKTTTIRLLLDIIGREEGTVTLLGKDNREHALDLKEDIGVVLDEAGFNECLTAKQVNKIMALTYKNWDSAEFFRLLETFKVSPDKKFKEFSKGTKMKLSIAVALSHKAKLLILDEATSGLDPVVRDEILDIFADFTRSEDHSILMSSHIVSDLEKICDYIAFLHQGKLLLCEEKDTLKEEYVIVHTTKEQFVDIPDEAIIGKKNTGYGVEVLALKDRISPVFNTSPADIEEIFLFMVKEA